MFTISLTGQWAYAETLARRLGRSVYAGWSVSNSTESVFTVANNTTVNLPSASNYAFSADPLATTIVIGWTSGGHTVEIPLNQFAFISPTSTPYLRNTASSGSSNPPVPVSVIAFT